MTTLTNTNVFEQSLQNLSKTLSDFGPLVTPIDDISTLVTNIDDLLVDIGDIINAANDIDDILILLGEVLEFLSAVPIVGEIADIFAGFLETLGDTFKDAIAAAEDINKDVIQPVVDVLNDVKKGLQDAKVVVVDISQKVPGYINTIEILGYLSEIAEPIVKVLKGTESETKLTALLSTFNDVQTDLGEALSKLDPVLKVIDAGVTDFTKILKDIDNAMGQGAQDVLNGIKSAASALSPISNGFQKLEHAIKPLAWVLDALACIFDTILKPVIDFILDATGINLLVEKAEDAIFKKLGISPIMNTAKNNISPNNLSDKSGAIGAKSGANSQRLWDVAGTALGQYRSGKDGGTRAAILGLVSAITNTEIDPGKPSVPPPFPPDVPNLNPADPGNATSSFLFAPRTVVSFDHSVLNRLIEPKTRVHGQSLSSLLASTATTSTSPLEKIDGSVWPNSAKLASNLATLISNLDALAPAAANLEGALETFEASFVLPATFSHQVSDLSEILNDAVSILNFFESIKVKFVDELVEPFLAVAVDQDSKMQDVVNKLPALQSAMTALESASESVISNVPKTEIVDGAIHRMEGWNVSIHQTIKLVDEARQRDSKSGNHQKTAIDNISLEIEQVANSLLSRVTKISTASASLTTAIDALKGGISAYAQSLKSLSSHSTLISEKALPAADRASHVLGLINSIVDPLSGLLQAENCASKTSPFKIFGATARDAINAAGEAAAKAKPGTFAEFAEKLSDKAFPVSQLASAIDSATTSINTQTTAAFQNQASNLVQGLKDLKSELATTESYTVTITTRSGEKKQITVDNDFFSQTLVAEANKIGNSLSQVGE